MVLLLYLCRDVLMFGSVITRGELQCHNRPVLTAMLFSSGENDDCVGQIRILFM